MMNINIWDAVPGHRVACRSAHGTAVKREVAPRHTSEFRFFLQVSEGSFKGWLSENLLSTEAHELIRDNLP